MTTYVIDFADPLRTGFSIPAGDFNGPGGDLSNTSLRLYGRGALEWGEAVNENLVRLAEHFAGATPPLLPLAGQLWLRQTLYVKNGTSFFRWNMNTNAWNSLSVTTTAGTIGAFGAGSTIGEYVYSTADNKLYRWDFLYKQVAVNWIERAFTSQATNPTTQQPVQDLLIYDEYKSAWVTPRAATTGNGLPGSGDYAGQLFYDLSSGTLYIWSETSVEWQEILGPADTGENTLASGPINMNGFNVTNMADPVNDRDAATKVWTLERINTLAINATGDTMLGTLTFSGANLDLANNRILNVTNVPTSATDAVNANYVNNQINSAISGLGISGGVVSHLTTPSGGDDGDLATQGGIAYMKIAGVWRQIWPAQFS